MKLCVASCKPVWRSSTAEGGFATDGGFPFQMAAISSLFDRTDLIVCERPAPPGTPGTPLPRRGVRVVPLQEPGGADTTRKLFLAGTSAYYLARIAACIARADAVHAVVPGDIGMLGMFLALSMRKRLFVRYCSSWPDTPQATRSNRLCKRVMRRCAGGRNVMFATGLGEVPPDGPDGRMRWIFSSSLTAAALDVLERETAARQPVPGLCRLLYVGRLSPEKGLLNLLEAVALLQGTGVETARSCSLSPCRWELTLAGHGPQLGALRERVTALGLEERVRFAGLLDRAGVCRELAAHDLFVLPSLTEGFPKALVEAMAAGLPAVASSVGAIPMILGSDSANGRVVSPGSVEALVEALAALGDSEAPGAAERERLGENARRRARAWTLEAWAREIGETLEAAWGLPLRGAVGPERVRQGMRHEA
jgi:glycosyltransferase involved in cell wall biosynthesis